MNEQFPHERVSSEVLVSHIQFKGGQVPALRFSIFGGIFDGDEVPADRIRQEAEQVIRTLVGAMASGALGAIADLQEKMSAAGIEMGS